ncbi:hypothetical protein [Urbifossiella limnaea]|uniref:Uncharacterized protein n=1 Tax=Urbifossiella limnaea TaxID=2528023 RepID=A0A517XZU3_9BACT|nr:hypothetical protein [Urbifossiella limnaea]QDU23031.1 hypothetical protein ETAA1_50210 [Urbifossiella limnaea]
MSHDRLAYAGMVLTAATTAVCAAVAAAYTLRAARRAAAAAAPVGAVAHARRWLGTAAAGGFLGLLLASLAYQYEALSHAAPPGWHDAPPRTETVQSAEWRAWRDQVHSVMTAGEVTDETVVRALRLRPPGVEGADAEGGALRRDQAVADVYMSYPAVQKLLDRKLGIKPDFLGTGLSKPLGQPSYAFAAVHEYLVENHPDTHDHVWLWKVKPPGRYFSRPLQDFLGGGPEDRVAPENPKKPAHGFDDELKEIQLRVKNKDHPFPPMVRFARFDEKFYKGTLGRPDAKRVFTSNLTEVWDLTIQQAAERSGYSYRGGGDTLFVWVYVPYHSNEFTPATWHHVLARLPDWLDGPAP